jgi:hypothetical protein
VAAVQEQRQQLQRARSQQLMRLRYEAGLAERQYRLVDPENRLVAAELERRWEQALRDLREAEQEAQAAEPALEPLTDDLRRQLAEAQPTLRQMWDSGALTNARKKELLRALIDKVVLKRPAPDACESRIIWKGGDWTTATLSLPVATYAGLGEGGELIAEVLRRVRAGQADGQIAAELTAAGYHAPLKEHLSAGSVQRIRIRHGVYSRKTEFQRHGLPGWITLGEAAKRLGEHTGWAYYLIRQRRLRIERDPEVGLYLVPDTKRSLKELKAVLRGKRLSLTIERRSS